MRSTRRIEALLIACTLLLAACPEAPDGPRFEGAGHRSPIRGGTLMLSEESKVRTLDPHLASDEISGVLTEMLFDSLYTYDQNMQVVPAIAQRLPEQSADGLVFSIPIRRGVRFHHGRELTSADVVWSLERMLSPDVHTRGVPHYMLIVGMEDYQAKRTNHVQGITAPDRYRVEITLQKPDQSFVHKLAMRFTSVLPKEIVESRGARFAAAPIGTGPFMLDNWERGVRLILKRNPYYYIAGLPHLDSIVFEEDIKRETAFLRFRNGEVDVISRVSPPDKALLQTEKWRKHMAISPRADVYAILMNAEMPPFDNAHVRRAVAFAIDRERWAKARNYGLRPTGQLLPPAVAGYDEKLPNAQHFDLARAKEELRLGGFPNGLKDPVLLWGTDSATMRTYGELLQSDLGKIGIQVQFKFVNFPVYLEETGKPKNAQILYGGWVMDYPDASNFLSLMTSATKAPQDAANRAFYSDPWLDKFLDEALIERDPVKRVAMYRQANDFVAREAPWAFFANSVSPQAWQPYVKNYKPHPAYWIPVNEVWLDLPRKRIAELTRRTAAALKHASFLPWELSP